MLLWNVGSVALPDKTLLHPSKIFAILFMVPLTGSYAVAGAYASALLFISIFASYLSKIEGHWDKSVKIYIAVLISSSLLLLTPQLFSPLFAVYLFSAAFTIATTPLNNQVTSNFIELTDSSERDRMHFWINREIYIYAGRASILIGLALILLYFPNNMKVLVYTIPLLAAYSLIYLKVALKNPKRVGVMHTVQI